MGDQAEMGKITFNGINGDTGGYLTDPLTAEELVERVNQALWSQDHLGALKNRKFGTEASFKVLPEYGDGSQVKRVGWGIIFPAGADPDQVDDILEALDGLVQFRKKEAGKYFKIFRDKDGHRWKNDKAETKDEFLKRHGTSVGPVDPNKVPFYLLIVADPQSIPFVFQYELDVQYAVGRIYFHTMEEYARYAQSVVKAENGEVKLARRAVYFGTDNPDDLATELSAEHLVKPLHKYTNDVSAEFDLGWTGDLVEPKDADRETLKTLLGGSQTPAFLFTASHGMAWPYNHHKLQRKYQGALVCQDWKGPMLEKAGRAHFLAAEDIPDDHNLLGSVVFNFACFGAGTPYWDEFAIAKNQDRTALSTRPFLSALPMRLLSHPNGGALAVIGHIERAWAYSFNWDELKGQTQAFRSVIYQLMDGKPVGMAMDDMNLRYAEIASMLSNNLQELKYDPKYIDAWQLASELTANNDARGYAVMGDPAVQIPVASKETLPSSPAVISLSRQYLGILPVVLAEEALAPLNEKEKQTVEEENQELAQELAAYVAQGPGNGASEAGGSPEFETEGITTPKAAERPESAGERPPRQAIQADEPLPGEHSGRAQPFASPVDGLAFALQAYASDEQTSVSFDMQGVSYNLMDDAKDKVKEVVVNLNLALSNLAAQMKKVTSEAATLQVSTGVVDDLADFDPQTADKRFVTRISATGDIEVYTPRQAQAVDEVLLALHRDMVDQALNNRLEIVKAIADTIASLFGSPKA
jgi:hypothetical protein